MRTRYLVLGMLCVLGLVLFGYLVSLTGNYDVPVLVMAAASTLGAAGWIWIDAGRPLVQE